MRIILGGELKPATLTQAFIAGLRVGRLLTEHGVDLETLDLSTIQESVFPEVNQGRIEWYPYVPEGDWE